MKNVRVIGFDADDTLWLNESFYQETEKQVCAMLTAFGNEQFISQTLYATEMQNMEQYGYGAKAFVLSLVETALKVGSNKLPPHIIGEIIELGKKLINRPVVLLEGVETVLETLFGNFRLVLATKGDLLDQERKLRSSGLSKYFHHVEIMPDKSEREYRKLLTHLNTPPDEFLMIGNSMKSDILPVLQLGGHAIHVPHSTTWLHETVEEQVEHPNLLVVPCITDVLELIK